MKAIFAIVFLALVAVSMAQYAYNYASYPAAAISTYGAYPAAAAYGGYYGLGAGYYSGYGAYPYFRR